jgi:hypothetical protein
MVRVRSVSLEQMEPIASRGELFALLDSCDEPSVPQRCLSGKAAPARSLYRGKSQDEYWHIAPYLSSVSKDELKWIASDLWSAPWGCFVVSKSGMDALYDHFRRFLQVQGTDGKFYLFRFYDPRVLRAFLQSSSPSELQQFYGPVTMFGVAASDGSLNVDTLWL